jgi:DNA ligase 1
MKHFVKLINDIDASTKTNDKVDALVNYFSVADKQDAIHAIALLSGNLPKRPVKTADIKLWAMEISGIPEWLFNDCYSNVGDLSETISIIIKSDQIHETTIPLRKILLELKNISKKSIEEKKEFITSYWLQFNQNERFIFNKLLGGNFRIGVSHALVIKALSKVYNIDDKIVSHRLMGNWSPEINTLDNLLLEQNVEDDYSKPYPFYLAYALEDELEKLGDINDWQLERKYDGIRGQIIIRNNQIYIWSRGEELVTDKFPELHSLKNILPNGTVLDGEILVYKNGAPLSFNNLQTRISRKSITKKILEENPVWLMAYDILEFNSIDIRKTPMIDRRQTLETLVSPFMQNEEHRITLSPLVNCDNWDEAKQAQQRAREFLCEGLMLKHKQSIYDVGRRRGNWYKWKVGPLTVDAVMIYAQSGSGRRANLFTDYTFAVWDEDKLVPFAKAYSGLTDKEINEVDAWVKKNTIEKFGPVRSVKPLLVFELAFEGINHSPRHKSGVALRFPRILRWRKDKTAAEANKKSDLLQLINAK